MSLPPHEASHQRTFARYLKSLVWTMICFSGTEVRSSYFSVMTNAHLLETRCREIDACLHHNVPKRKMSPRHVSGGQPCPPSIQQRTSRLHLQGLGEMPCLR